jgi:hypothetical protein
VSKISYMFEAAESPATAVETALGQLSAGFDAVKNWTSPGWIVTTYWPCCAGWRRIGGG